MSIPVTTNTSCGNLNGCPGGEQGCAGKYVENEKAEVRQDLHDLQDRQVDEPF